MANKGLIYLTLLLLLSCNTVISNENSTSKTKGIDLNNFEIKIEKDISTLNEKESAQHMVILDNNVYLGIAKNFKDYSSINIHKYDLDFIEDKTFYKPIDNQVSSSSLFFDLAVDSYKNLYLFKNQIKNNNIIDIALRKQNLDGTINSVFNNISINIDTESLYGTKIIPNNKGDIFLLGSYSLDNNSFDTIGFIRKFKPDGYEYIEYRKDLNVKENFDIVISGTLDLDNNLIIGGYSQQNATNNFDNGFIQKYSQKGKLLWETKLEYNNEIVTPTDIKFSKNQKIYVSCIGNNIANNQSNSDIIFFILNSNGQIEEVKLINYDNNFEYIRDFYILESGNILIGGDISNNGQYDIFVSYINIDDSKIQQNSNKIILGTKQETRITGITVYENNIFLLYNKLDFKADNIYQNVTLVKLSSK